MNRCLTVCITVILGPKLFDIWYKTQFVQNGGFIKTFQKLLKKSRKILKNYLHKIPHKTRSRQPSKIFFD